MSVSQETANRSRPLHYLRKAREHKGISARELSRLTGIARATLTDLENVQRGAYKSTVRKLAEALGCEPWELTGVDPWEMSERERELLRHVMAGGKPYAVFVEEDEEDEEGEV